ncbi:MAG: thermonuclease family protein [Hyphomicrobiaceae bacterium]
MTLRSEPIAALVAVALVVIAFAVHVIGPAHQPAPVDVTHPPASMDERNAGAQTMPRDSTAAPTGRTDRHLPEGRRPRHFDGQVHRGIARVVDGDTIIVAGQRIRLEGIDAPELGQSCQTTTGLEWDAGKAARRKLERLIGGRPVECQQLNTDRYGRAIAICKAGGTDLNARLVAEGYAWAFVKYSKRYVAEERLAKSERRGIWDASCPPAWEFRARRWQTAQQQAPEGCPIKGNISRAGRIYHPPWSPWYAKTTVTAERGERWFCSEAEALAAGFRPASS